MAKFYNNEGMWLISINKICIQETDDESQATEFPDTSEVFDILEYLDKYDDNKWEVKS